MRSEIPKKSLRNEDALEQMAGGWASDFNTPTHFFGRRETEAVLESTAGLKRKRKQARKKQSSRIIEHWKVAPGVIIAYEMPASPTKSPGDRGLAQTEQPIDESASSLLDHDRPLMHGAAEDAPEYMSSEEESLAKGDVPKGEDMMSEKKPLPVQPGFDIEVGEKAQEEGRTALPPTPQVGLAGNLFED
jgi:hypothetical protein